MRILRVITRLNIGGPARQVCFLHRVMMKDEHECHLIYGKLDEGEGDFSSLLDERRNATYLKSLVRPIRIGLDILSFFKIYFWLCKHPVDVVHTHTAKAGLVARSATLLYAWSIGLFKTNRIKMIHTYHGHVFSGYFSPLKTKLVKTVERFLWQRSHAIITLNQKLSDELCEHLNVVSEKIELIPLGLDLNKYLNLNRSHYFSHTFDQDEQCQWIGWVGRLTEIKNPFRFLDICEKILDQSNKSLRFVLVGDGTLRKTLEERIANGPLNKKVFLLGWAEDLVQVYSSLDFFINTSDNEGTPVAALEALAAGVPVALSDVGGTREAVPESRGVHLFDPNNYDTQIKHWIEAIGHRLDPKLSEEIVEKFSEQNLYERLLKLYNRLLQTS